MNDKELKEIRENIACPQFGDDHYGPWGALTLTQRKTTYRLLEEIKSQKAEIERLQEKYSRTMDGLKAVLAERADHSEAIKEFAERLKRCFDRFQIAMYSEGTVVETINNLVKEMVGDL